MLFVKIMSQVTNYLIRRKLGFEVLNSTPSKQDVGEYKEATQ